MNESLRTIAAHVQSIVSARYAGQSEINQKFFLQIKVGDLQGWKRHIIYFNHWAHLSLRFG